MQKLAILVSALLLSSAFADISSTVFHGAKQRHVMLKAGSVNTHLHPQFHNDETHALIASQHEAEARHQYLVHVDDISYTVQQAIEACMGAKLGIYMPHNTFMLFATQDTAAKARSCQNVLWVGAYLPNYKYPENIESLLGSSDFSQEKLFVMLVPGQFTEAEAKDVISEWNSRLEISAIASKIAEFEVTSGDRVFLKLHAVGDVSILRVVQWLAEQPECHWVDVVPAFISQHDAQANLVLQSNGNPLDGTYVWDNGVDGTGVVVGLIDNGVDYTSCYLNSSVAPPPPTVSNIAQRKIVKYKILPGGDTSDGDGHGTFIAGSIIGSAQDVSLVTANGLAYGAKLYVADFGTGTVNTIPSDLTSTFLDGYNGGVDSGPINTVTGTSIMVVAFGANATSGYGSSAVVLDAFQFRKKDFLAVVAAGTGVFTEYALSKNALVVGASQNTRIGGGFDTQSALADFSPRGPTPDGRIKPDIVAPAQSLSSTARGACGVESRQGTSYAAGMAAGTLALIRQYLSDGFYNGNAVRNIQASAMKAMIINSGQSLLTAPRPDGSQGPVTFPDGNQGFGRPQLDQTLTFANSTFFTLLVPTATVANQGSSRVCFTVADGAPQVKATLVWTDRDGSPSSSVSLVANLDLVVIDSNGNEWRTQTVSQGFDAVNNVEQVVINFPAAGDYAAIVYGYSVSSASQDYSLVITGNIDPLAPCQAMTSVCPRSCSGLTNACNATNGACTCPTGRVGVDCSGYSCPSDCSGHGTCNILTGTCTCYAAYSGTDCAAAVVTTSGVQYVTQGVSPSGKVDLGLFIGIVIAAFFIGLLIALVLGGYGAVKYMIHKRDKALAEEEEMRE